MNIEEIPLVPKPVSVPDWVSEARQGLDEAGNEIFILVARLPDGAIFHVDCLAKNRVLEPMVNNLGGAIFVHEYSAEDAIKIFRREAEAIAAGRELSPRDREMKRRMKELSYGG